MVKNYISETNELNLIELSNIDGDKIYYNSFATYFNLIFHCSLTITFIIFSLIVNEFLVYFMVYFLMIFFVYEIAKTLSFVLFKNPIFILNGSKLYYTRNNKWYDLDKNIVDIVTGGRYNHIDSFRLTNEKNEVEVLEDLWRIKNNDILRQLKNSIDN